MTKLLVCPECGSDKVRVWSATSYDPNTGDFVGHSRKAHDDDTVAYCGIIKIIAIGEDKEIN